MKSHAKNTVIIFLLLSIGVATAVYFSRGGPRVAEVHTIDGITTDLAPSDAGAVATIDTPLYFTASGCMSTPHVSAKDDRGQLRTAEDTISATDGYDYRIVDGTQAQREMRSQFTGKCEDITPAPLDSFAVLEVGVTEKSVP